MNKYFTIIDNKLVEDPEAINSFDSSKTVFESYPILDTDGLIILHMKLKSGSGGLNIEYQMKHDLCIIVKKDGNELGTITRFDNTDGSFIGIRSKCLMWTTTLKIYNDHTSTRDMFQVFLEKLFPSYNEKLIIKEKLDKVIPDLKDKKVNDIIFYNMTPGQFWYDKYIFSYDEDYNLTLLTSRYNYNEDNYDDSKDCTLEDIATLRTKINEFEDNFRIIQNRCRLLKLSGENQK